MATTPKYIHKEVMKMYVIHKYEQERPIFSHLIRIKQKLSQNCGNIINNTNFNLKKHTWGSVSLKFSCFPGVCQEDH